MNEIEEAKRFLHTLEPGFLPFPIFSEIARLAVLVTIEVGIFFKDAATGDLKVMLQQRPADDAWWPNQRHVAGSILRATDRKHSFHDAFARIENECKCKLIAPILFRTDFRQEERGAMFAVQHYVVLGQSLSSGSHFDLDALPNNLVPEHRSLIEIAAKKIKESD